MTDPAGTDRSFTRIAVVVGVLSTLAFSWFLTLGRGDVVQYRAFGEVFDLQARAFLHGRLSLPDGSLGFEGFVVGGKTYAYFGIFPSLLRLPLFLVTDHFDGRLSAVSMLVAYVIALWAAAQVVRRTHALLRPGQAWTRTGLAAAAALLAVIGLGSNLLFLASGAWVYHEASLWGAAGVLASFAACLRFLDEGRLRSVVAAGIWAAVAWTSRGSVGLAPSAVLGLLALARLTGHPWLAVLAPPPERPADADADADADAAPLDEDELFVADEPTAARRPADAAGPRPPAWSRDLRLGGALLVAAVAGALVFGAVNTAKFGGPTTLPMDEQVASAHPWPDRERALEVYDGSLFSARLIPSVLYQSLRPDLLAPTDVWPFVRFTAKRPPTPSGLVFDTVEPSAGLTVTSPLLLVLAGVGAAAALRRRRPSSARSDTAAPVRAAVLRPFLIGGLAATYAPLTIAFIAQRYLTDALPLLVVGAAGGLAALDGWAARRSAPAQRRLPRAALAGVVVLAGFGLATTAAVTWSFQRFVIPPDPAARAAGLRAQVAVADVIGAPPAFRRYARALPEQAPSSGLAVLGDCAGLYVGQTDGSWAPLEVAAAAGHHRLLVRLDGSAGTEPRAVLAVGDQADHLVVAVSGPARAARFSIVRNGVAGPVGSPVDLSGAGRVVDLSLDPAFAWVRVSVDGQEARFEPGGPPQDRTATVGIDPFGAVAPLPVAPVVERTPTPTCDDLVAAHG